jgi:hypothetical protein
LISKEYAKKSEYKDEFWFTSDKEYAKYRAGKYGGKIVKEVFLNIRNPKTETDVREVRKSEVSIDGYICYQKKWDSKIDDYIDAQPLKIDMVVATLANQIKSATNNIGNFNTENPDIRFQFVGKKDVQSLDKFDTEDTARNDQIYFSQTPAQQKINMLLALKNQEKEVSQQPSNPIQEITPQQYKKKSRGL